MDDYSQTLGINPNNSDIYTYRGNIYTDMGLHDQALLDYGKAINLNSDDYRAYFNRGNIQAFFGHFDKSIDDYNAAIKINSEVPEVYFSKASLLEKSNKIVEAISNFALFLIHSRNDSNAIDFVKDKIEDLKNLVQ